MYGYTCLYGYKYILAPDVLDLSAALLAVGMHACMYIFLYLNIYMYIYTFICQRQMFGSCQLLINMCMCV